MIKTEAKRLLTIPILAIIFLLTQNLFLSKVFASYPLSVTSSQNSDSSYNLIVNFQNQVPSGNIIDLELYNQQNQRVWQYYTSQGGNTVTAKTISLNSGSYSLSIGLFTPFWGSNYEWYSNAYTIIAVPQAPSVAITNNSQSSFIISLNFSQNVPSGNIIDMEIEDSSGNKVWQSFTANGGNSYTATTPSLPNGQYTMSAGIFTPFWASNLAWYPALQALSVPANTTLNQSVPSVSPVPAPMPSPTPVPSPSPTPAPASSTPGPTPSPAPSPSSLPTQSNGSVTVTPASNSEYNINVNLSTTVPSGNIIDLELYNSSNQKVWQTFTNTGGNSISGKTSPLSSGNYTLKLGLFTPGWASNYSWNNNLFTFTAGSSALPVSSSNPTPSPTPTPTSVSSVPSSQAPTPSQNNVNSAVESQALSFYNSWKSNYVQSAGGNMLRVVRPQNNNDTVSEGIGYGMLLSYFAGDQQTFQGLWNYGKNYLDSKGLMNWQINSSGSVIGQGSATDADEDMAYALLRAHSKWPGNRYGLAANGLISAMMNTEVQSSNLINPGDNWGTTQIMNPSYLAPAYYRAFANFTGNSKWNDVANANLSWLQNAANQSTGLVPDWLNADYSQPSISWDQYPDGFYYDAVRNPIRMLMDYKWNNSQGSLNILNKQYGFVSGVGVANLKSGYSLSGSPLTSYIDATFLAAYAAIGQANPSSSYANSSINALTQQGSGGYFGDSLRAISLFVIAGAQ